MLETKTAVLTESMIVAEYLCEQFPEAKLLPTDCADRATLRLFLELCGSSAFFHFFSIPKARGDSAQFEAAVAALTEGMVNTNSFLEAKGTSGGPFLFGNQFTLAECAAGPFVQRACTILPAFTGEGSGAPYPVDPMKICDDKGLARLKEWMIATLARPSVKAWKMPEADMKESTARIVGM